MVAPHPIDVMVGKRVRVRRAQLGISQTALAEKIGITFQQVQKYEKGTNRISCSRLFGIATVLEVPITYFFSEFPGDKSEMKFIEQVPLEQVKESLQLLKVFCQIGDPIIRRKAIALLESVAKLDSGSTVQK